MRKITVSIKGMFSNVTLINKKSYQFFRARHGEKPKSLGKRFKAIDWEVNVPNLEKGYIYTIQRIRCIPGEMKLVPEVFIKKKPIVKACITSTHVLIVCSLSILGVYIIRNLQSNSSFHNLLFFFFVLVYIVFSNNYSVSGTSEKIVYTVIKKIRKND